MFNSKHLCKILIIRFFSIILIICVCSNLLNGQHLNFKNFSIDDGLQSSLVFASQEDDNGYIWFATEKGISRYDGISFEYFNEKDGLTENSFYQIIKDSNNTIWFVSNNFKVFYFKNQRFNRLETKEKICWIDIDKENKTWFLTRDGNLFLLNSNLKIDKYFTLEINNFTIYYSFKCLNYNEFIFSNQNEVFSINKNKKRIKHNIKVSVVNNHIVSRFFYKEDSTVLITCSKGIYSLKNSILNFEYSLSSNQVYCFY